jgi:anti-sigma regulatory factor (Ser/Thr protein kinase)
MSNVGNIIKLAERDITKLRTGTLVHSFSEAVSVLLRNAIDAECSTIYVEVDFQRSAIMMLDDGNGVSDMKTVGERYCVRDVPTGGGNNRGRGESLASLVNSCDELKIISRCMQNLPVFRIL